MELSPLGFAGGVMLLVLMKTWFGESSQRNGTVSVGRIEHACWEDAMWWWEQDSRNTAQTNHREQEVVRQATAAHREAQKCRQVEAILARQEAERVLLACACERGRNARAVEFARAVQWEGYNPGEVQFWDQSRSVNSSMECNGARRGCCRARVAAASGTCGGTWTWRKSLQVHRAHRVREAACVSLRGALLSDRVKSPALAEVVCARSVATVGEFADVVLLFMTWYSFQCYEVFTQRLLWRAVVLELCGKKARVVQGVRVGCARRSPGRGAYHIREMGDATPTG